MPLRRKSDRRFLMFNVPVEGNGGNRLFAHPHTLYLGRLEYRDGVMQKLANLANNPVTLLKRPTMPGNDFDRNELSFGFRSDRGEVIEPISPVSVRTGQFYSCEL